MKDSYILDACAIIAFLLKEPGAEKVRDLFQCAGRGEVSLFMHNINVFEVYYGVHRAEGEEVATDTLNDIKSLPIAFLSEFSDDALIEAGRLKASYKMSLADAVLVAEASIVRATVVTSDHHELDTIDQKENIDFYWFR
ncbi:MAG: type II toxin-antitoxin system VapC family toxin [Synergistaceae bacterium]|nr:type II toxin-antitoxin system VapC family toxin [Synergistaceae bacterium]